MREGSLWTLTRQKKKMNYNEKLKSLFDEWRDLLSSLRLEAMDPESAICSSVALDFLELTKERTIWAIETLEEDVRLLKESKEETLDNN